MKSIILDYKQHYSFRERALLWLLGNVVEVHARVYSNREPWKLSTEDLARYLQGTLGRELHIFLKDEQLQPVPKIERHDAFHILFGFATTLNDEAAMQYFLVGNGKISPFGLATTIFTGLVMPDRWSDFSFHYKRGKAARSIANWDFKELLNENFEDLRSYIFNRPFNNPALLNKIAKFG
jgi:ubiquinone biosynthesis protein Coq4